MRLSMRLKLLIVPVIMCLTLFMALSGTAFASSGTHPHLSGPEDATTTNGCINIHIHGSNFTPSTKTTTNEVGVFTIASTYRDAGGQAFFPIDKKGNFSATFTICNITAVPDKIEYIALDQTTGFYSNTVFTKANK